MNIFRIICFVLFTFSFADAYSQTWDSLSVTMSKYYNQGKIRIAKIYAEKALRVAEKDFGIDHEKYCLSLNNLGRVYLELEEYDKALSLYLKAVDNCKSSIGTEDPDYALILYNVATLYRILELNEKAIFFFNNALNIVEKSVNNYILHYKILKDLGFIYYSIGEYEKALILYTEAKSIIEETNSKEDVIYCNVLNNLALVYKKMENYKKSEHMFQQALENCGNTIIDDYSKYSTLLNNFGKLYEDQGQYDKAVFLYFEEIRYIEMKLGKSDSEYGSRLSNLGLLYSKMGQYENALPIYLGALENIESNLGKSSLNYYTLQYSIGFTYLKLEKFVNAIPFFEESLKNTEINDKSYASYILTLKILGFLYSQTEQYEKALSIYLKALKTTDRNVGKADLDYLEILNEICGLYSKIGQYEEALPYALEAIKNTEISEGKAHESYGTMLHSLGRIYLEMGQYEKALPVYLEALNNSERNFGKSHLVYGSRLNNLAVIYLNIGQYEKALSICLEALEIIEKNLGKSHLDYGIRLNTLGNILTEMGQHEKALPFLLEALQNTEENLGKSDPICGTILNNIGILYSEIGLYEKALDFYLEAMRNTEKNLGKDHSTYGSNLNNIGLLYSNMGQYNKALSLLIESLENLKKNLGKDHPKFGMTLTAIGFVYFKMGEHEKALSFYSQGSKLLLDHFSLNSKFLSEEENVALYNLIQVKLINYKVLLFLTNNKINSVTADFYDLELQLKSIILRSTINMRQAVLVNSDTLLYKKYDEWMKLRSILTKQNTLPISKRRADLSEVQNDSNTLETELARVSAPFRDELNEVKWIDIQELLDSNKVAIEFMDIPYLDEGKFNGNVMIAALVLKKIDSFPHLVPLFSKNKLDSLIVRNTTKESSYINKIYSDGNLYDLIWKPLESYIPKGSHIYFAPSGILNKINLGAIATSDSTYLSDDYQFSQVSTTAVIASTIKEEKAVQDIAIFGGIEFDAKEVEITKVIAHISKDHDYVSRGLYTADSTRAGKWTFLNGTLQEAKNIDALARENKVVSKFYTGVDAVEENFKNLTGKASPSVLHIATHGFFFPDPKLDKQKLSMNSFQEENAFTIADNPLNRSGLLFAGGNSAWVGDTISTTREDGILTAYEACNTSLSNTQLVVLSACETGLGDIKGSEGVYGLQRAFKMAGAQYLMMSLWKVPDQATKEFMTAFYTELFTNKQSIRTSYNLAQSAMKIKYRNEPYKWGGFVLIE